MAQVIPNFARTTLRAPVGVSDTQLLLVSGGGAFFNFTAGDWCFLTVNDSTTAEVMKYTSTGSVIDNTITVERAQDNTTAKAFPAGACVTVGWNTEQVYDFILQTVSGSSTSDTQTITGPTAVPSGAPPSGIFFTINLNTGQLWFWDGSEWIAILSNSVVQVTEPPVGVPPFGTIWAVDTVAGALYYWTGAAWIQIAGSAAAGLVEIYSRVNILDPASTFAIGAYSFATSGLMAAASVAIDYHVNPLVATNITIPAAGPNAQRIVFTDPCIAEITVSINGGVTDSSFSAKADLVLTHSGGATAYGSEYFYPNTSSSFSPYVIVNTGPVAVTAGDAWDMTLVINDGVGATYSTIDINQFTATVTIIAMLPVV